MSEPFGGEHDLVANSVALVTPPPISVLLLLLLALHEQQPSVLEVLPRLSQQVLDGLDIGDAGPAESDVEWQLLLAAVEVVRSEACGLVRAAVVGDLDRHQELVPIRAVLVHVCAQHVLDHAIGPLRLAVGLRVVCRAEAQLSAEQAP